MIWNTCRDSTRIPTKDGALAVRVDGDTHKLRCSFAKHSEAYRAINPRGVVPTLVLDDGTAIGEVPAIMRYLDEAFDA